MKILCDIYRSGKKPDMYVYVPHSEGLKNLPEPLLKQFGRAELAMTILLTPEKKLARAKIDQVLACLREPGYYLQMPPQAESYMQGINLNNDRLTPS